MLSEGKLLRFSVLLVCCALSPAALADLSSPGALPQESRQQEQRQEALRQQLQSQAPDVRLQPERPSGDLQFPEEQPCFEITETQLESDEPQFTRLLQPLMVVAEDRCLGIEGINRLIAHLQNRLIDAGWITSRVLAPAQDLSQGRLRLVVVTGQVAGLQLEATEGRHIDLNWTLPLQSGQPLNLRDLEQGLENLQRLPGTQAKVELLPGEQPGDSVVKVRWQQEKLWRFSLSLDDAGSEQTGEKQAAATLFLDNPWARGICSISPVAWMCSTLDGSAATVFNSTTRFPMATGCLV